MSSYSSTILRQFKSDKKALMAVFLMFLGLFGARLPILSRVSGLEVIFSDSFYAIPAKNTGFVVQAVLRSHTPPGIGVLEAQKMTDGETSRAYLAGRSGPTPVLGYGFVATQNGENKLSNRNFKDLFVKL